MRTEANVVKIYIALLTVSNILDRNFFNPYLTNTHIGKIPAMLSFEWASNDFVTNDHSFNENLLTFKIHHIQFYSSYLELNNFNFMMK